MSDDFFNLRALAVRTEWALEAKRDGKLLGLWLAGEHVLGVSNERVPFEEGDFADGGGVSQDEATGTTAVSYTDTAFVGQAAMLHENMEMRHDEDRMAKFLELTMASEKDIILALAREALRSRMGL